MSFQPRSNTAVQFCELCGAILDHSIPICQCCNHANELNDTVVVMTKELPGKSAWLREATEFEREIVRMPCDSCGEKYQYFSSRQLRSADEAETIFLECTKCHNKTVL